MPRRRLAALFYVLQYSILTITSEGATGEMPARSVVLSLEGNIGAGKSTLLAILAQRSRFRTVQEPLRRWQGQDDSHRTNLLAEFYRDPQRWAFTFQTAAFLSRAQAALQTGATCGDSATVDTCTVMERRLGSPCPPATPPEQL